MDTPRLIDGNSAPNWRNMVHYPDHYPSFGDRVSAMAARGIRIAKRMALAFGLAVIGGIAIGAAATDNAFALIFVSILAAVGLWVPILFALLGVERLFARRGPRPAATAIVEAPAAATGAGASWRRLANAAPAERERIASLQRSLDNSHRALAAAKLDPDAHDLCVLIDRRLPELIDRELDSLPPDDRGRRQGVDELIGLVEQFARHCGRKRDGQQIDTSHQAQVLRRRFEERLAPPPFENQ